MVGVCRVLFWCFMVVVGCALFVVRFRWLFSVAGCLLLVVCCVLIVVCWSLFGVCCVLLVVSAMCCLWVVVC